MRLLLLAVALLLCLPDAGAQAHLSPARCQSAEETEIAAALAHDGIAEPDLALTGMGQSAAAAGGEWVVVGWRPCVDPKDEPEAGLSTRISLYHRADRAQPRPVASITLPSVQRYVSPSEDPVVETAWGPLLLIEVATGGNCWTCERLLPLLLSGDRLLPMEPRDTRVGLREVTASDPDIIITGVLSTFENYGPLCHACSPSTTIYMKLEKDRLVEACDQYRDSYSDDAAAAKEELEAFAATARGDDDAVELFSRALARLLDQLNGGVTPQRALQDFTAMTERVRRLSRPQQAATLAASANNLTRAVILAEQGGKLNRACPALGLERPAGH